MLRRIGTDGYILTKRAVVAFVVSWLSLIVAIVWVGWLGHDIQTERKVRQQQVTQALSVNCERREYLIQATRRLFVSYQSLPYPSHPTLAEYRFYRTLDETIMALAPFDCTNLPIFGR